MIKLTNGFNEKCSNEEYHGDREYKSSSALKLILKDPVQYYKSYVLNEPQTFSSDALAIGSYAHTRVLEPHLEDEEYAFYYGRRQGKDWEEFKETVNGRTVITGSQKTLVDNMFKSYEKASVKLGNPAKEVMIASFFEDGKAEETLCGEIDGYKVKVRFDYRKQEKAFASINDLKTTGSPMNTREEVEDICSYWGYDVSAALYVDVVTQETGQKHDFYFVFISKKNFETRIFKASEEMLERGRKQYKEAIRLLKIAEKTGVYFDNKIEELR